VGRRDRHGRRDRDRGRTAWSRTGHRLDRAADAYPQHNPGDQLQSVLAAKHPVLGQGYGGRRRGEERLMMAEQCMRDVPGQPGGNRRLHAAPAGVGHPAPDATDGHAAMLPSVVRPRIVRSGYP
jgi:hypothetical protein